MRPLPKVLICLLLIATSGDLFGQQLPDRARLAAKYFENRQYGLAADLYASLLRSDEKTVYVKNIAECYRQTKKYGQAEKWYAREMMIEPTQGIQRFYYGDILLQNGKSAEARNQFNLFVPVTVQDKILKDQRLASLDVSPAIAARKTGFTILNARDLNTGASDFAAAITGVKMVFVSNRQLSRQELKENPAFRKTYGWTNQPFWKLFETRFEALGNPDKPSLLSPIINSPYNNGPAVFNQSGTMIWFSKAEELPGQNGFFGTHKFTSHNGLYYSTKANGIWASPKPFAFNKLKQYSVSHPALSPDGNLLYFASDMPGGKGGVDLYYITLKDGQPSGSPVNLGDSVNTALDEEFPSVGPDSVLYFSSTGHKGFGGLDLFSAKGSGNKWSGVENLGTPVNSNKDDFLIIFRPGNAPYRGYFSSNRDGGLGDDDIYAFEYTPLKPAVDSVALLASVVKRQVLLKDSIRTFFKLKSLDKLQGKTIQIPNIYYKTNRADPEPVAFPVLDRMVKLLQLFPKMEIEIRSHTDAIGDAKSNLRLSQDRANWVKTYLVLHGIPIARLSSRGFGKSRMLVKCGIKKPCTAKQNQTNRRTELAILKQ